MSGGIDFALFVNRDWAVLGFPYVRVKRITVKDTMYPNVDDGRLLIRSCINFTGPWQYLAFLKTLDICMKDVKPKVSTRKAISSSLLTVVGTG